MESACTDGRARDAVTRRVLFVTYDFPPTTAMAGETCAQIARYLPAHGWEPIVVAARTAASRGWSDATPGSSGPVVRAGAFPHPFDIYKGCRRLLTWRRGRHVVPPQVALPPPARRRTWRRWLLALLDIPDAHTGWVAPAVVAGLRAVGRYRPDHLLSSSPHSSGHLVGLVLARVTGLPWTAWFQDPWTYPQAQWEASKPTSALSMRIERTLERAVLRRAGRVVCVTDRHARWLRQSNPEIRADKFVTIPNGFDSGELQGLAIEPSPSNRGNAFVIRYVGSLYHRRSPHTVFQAVAALVTRGDVSAGRIRIDLVGHYDAAERARLVDMARGCGLAGSVQILGPVSRAQALQAMAQADLLLLLAEELTIQVPGKTYEYLKIGRPILALTSEGSVADLLDRTGGAWVVEPADVPAIAESVRQAYRRWSDGLDPPRPDPGIVAGFDRRVLAGRFAALFDSLSPRLRSGAPRADREPSASAETTVS